MNYHPTWLASLHIPTHRLYTIHLPILTFIFEIFKQMLFFFKWPWRLNVRLCWAEHAARTERYVTNTELNLGNTKTVPMFEHWDLKRYGECALNYRHSPISPWDKEYIFISLGLFTTGKSPRYLLHRWHSGFESCSGQSRAKKQAFPYKESNFVI